MTLPSVLPAIVPAVEGSGCGHDGCIACSEDAHKQPVAWEVLKAVDPDIGPLKSPCGLKDSDKPGTSPLD